MNRPKAITLALVAATAAAGLAGGCRRQPAPPQVVINGKTWSVELAISFQEQYRGLAGRQHLPDGAGMLFFFRQPAVQVFCMRGCVIPLDIAFIDADRKVVRTYTMAVETDLAGSAPYGSQVPVKYALEVAAGALSAAGVKPGDTVTLLGDIPG